jgi:periplasmic protein TonB
MWYPDPAAVRLHHDRQARTLYACLGVSIVLHGLALLSFPALGPADRQDDARALTALFASRNEPAAVAPVPAPVKPRQRREAEAPAPIQRTVEPAGVATAVEPTLTQQPVPLPAAPTSLASIFPEPVPAAAPARAPTDALDPRLFDAYRLALINAAKRYKRYPVQAVERGWEGRVEIRVVVDANGTIKSALVKSSSRYQILDNQALDMVRKAFSAIAQVQPVPRGHEFTVDVPVIFELRTG